LIDSENFNDIDPAAAVISVRKKVFLNVAIMNFYYGIAWRKTADICNKGIEFTLKKVAVSCSQKLVRYL
jgi:hypothetical protein